ncbi:MAG: NAD(P)/FAD-dependent oxidoreductase [Thermoflexales bacterium]
MDLHFELPTTGDGAASLWDVAIVGGGPAGATAAMYAARADLRVIVLDKGLTASALGITSRIANYPGVPEEISGAELLRRMREQAQRFGAVFVQDKVQAVDLESDPKLLFANGGTYEARAVIIATGSMARGQRVKGEAELLGRGVSYCATCDGAFFRDQDVAVAGNTDEAVEEALFLTRFARTVHFLAPTPRIHAPEPLLHELSSQPNVRLYLGAALREVIGGDHVTGVRVALRDGGEQVLPVSGAFIYLQGGKPATDFLAGQLPLNETGCVRVDAEYRTTIPGVYAIGDVLCNHVKQAVVAAAEGAIAAMAVEKALRGRKQLAVDWSK